MELRHRTIDSHQFLEVMLMSLCLGTHLHCPELPNVKMSSAETDTLLAIENWAWRGESSDQHEQKHQRQPNRQQKQNAGNIEGRFPTGYLVRGRCWKVDCNTRSFRPVPARAVIGQAAALGRPPDMREMTFYPHLMVPPTTANPLIVRDYVSGEAPASKSPVH